jgi:hypothetical protein
VTAPAELDDARLQLRVRHQAQHVERVGQADQRRVVRDRSRRPHVHVAALADVVRRTLERRAQRPGVRQPVLDVQAAGDAPGLAAVDADGADAGPQGDLPFVLAGGRARPPAASDTPSASRTVAVRTPARIYKKSGTAPSGDPMLTKGAVC